LDVLALTQTATGIAVLVLGYLVFIESRKRTAAEDARAEAEAQLRREREEREGGVSTDKTHPLRDRPSAVVKHVHADALIRQLEAVLPPKHFDTESTADELPPAA
jgi:hypothetical protein